MTDDDLEDFCEIWAAACEIATGKSPSQKALEFTFGALMDLRLDEIMFALERHTNHPDTCDFWPKAGSIRRAIIGGGDLVSQQAWQKVYHAIRCIGHMEDVRFEDPLIMQTIKELGGWHIMLDTDDKSLSYKENDFKKTYRALTITGLKDAPPFVFRGAENSQRIAAGLELKSFPSYERKLQIAKTRQESIKTLPRPIDAAINAGIEGTKEINANKTLESIKNLLGIVQINQKKENE